MDPTKFPLRLVRLDYDPNPALKGWSKFRISVPPKVRARYMDDAVYGEEWLKLLNDFDSKSFVSNDIINLPNPVKPFCRNKTQFFDVLTTSH